LGCRQSGNDLPERAGHLSADSPCRVHQAPYSRRVGTACWDVLRRSIADYRKWDTASIDQAAQMARAMPVLEWATRSTLEIIPPFGWLHAAEDGLTVDEWRITRGAGEDWRRSVRPGRDGCKPRLHVGSTSAVSTRCAASVCNLRDQREWTIVSLCLAGRLLLWSSLWFTRCGRGLPLFRRLQREPTTPVLFALRAQLQVRALPSLLDRRASENGLRASIVAFLAKPIFQSPLIAFCHRALRQLLAQPSQLF
jgi:hypothetical protein